MTIQEERKRDACNRSTPQCLEEEGATTTCKEKLRFA